MGFMDQLRALFGSSTTTDNTPTSLDEMRDAIEKARLARRSEDYTAALDALDAAMRLADERHDSHSVAVIALHQADVLIDKGDYAEAEDILSTVQQTSSAVNQRGFAAYALVSLGNLYRERGEREMARDTFEKAREQSEGGHSPGALGRALGYLGEMYLNDGNASYAVHLLEDCIPMLNTAGDVELGSRFTGALGQALIITGQDVRGKQLLDEAIRQAERLQDKPMLRRWSVVAGDHAQDDGRYETAYQHYKKALVHFEAGPSPAYIHALTQISRATMKMGQPEEALLYAEQAVRVAEYSVDDHLKAAAYGSLGLALRANQRHEEALPALQTAVNLDGSAQLDLIRNLAAAQVQTGAFDEAAATYDRVLQLARQGAKRIDEAQTHRDRGLLYLKQGNLPEAITAWTEALTIFEDEHDYNQSARLYCDIASTRRTLGQGNRAIRDFERALMMLNHVDDLATRGLVLSNAGNAYADQGDTESADSFFREAIDIARQTKDHTAESTRLGNYGWFLTATGRPRQGIERLTLALEISREQHLTLQTAVQTDNLGLAYDALAQYKTALTYHEDAISQLNPDEPTHHRWLAQFKANTARTLLALARPADAEGLLTEAETIARAANDFEALTAVLVNKARLRLAQQRPDDAGAIVQEATALASRGDARRLLAEGLAVRSEQQAAVGDMDAARKTWDEAKRLLTIVQSPAAKQTPFWLGNNPPTEA